MMKNTKKPYIAPAAELILLAPLEALAAKGIYGDDDIALRNWGKNVIPNASVTGGKQTYWGDDGSKK